MNPHRTAILGLIASALCPLAHATEASDPEPARSAVYLELAGPTLTGLSLNYGWRFHRFAAVRGGVGTMVCRFAYTNQSQFCPAVVYGADVLLPLGRVWSLNLGAAGSVIVDSPGVMPVIGPQAGVRAAVPMGIYFHFDGQFLAGWSPEGNPFATPWAAIAVGMAF